MRLDILTIRLMIRQRDLRLPVYLRVRTSIGGRSAPRRGIRLCGLNEGSKRRERV